MSPRSTGFDFSAVLSEQWESVSYKFRTIGPLASITIAYMKSRGRRVRGFIVDPDPQYSSSTYTTAIYPATIFYRYLSNSNGNVN